MTTNDKRRETKTTVSLSVPVNVLEKLKRLADKNQRNLSSMVGWLIYKEPEPETTEN